MDNKNVFIVPHHWDYDSCTCTYINKYRGKAITVEQIENHELKRVKQITKLITTQKEG